MTEQRPLSERVLRGAQRRGLDALIPTAPAASAPDARVLQWKQLEAALFSLTNAQFEYERGDLEAGRMHVDDARRALGTVALTMAEGPDAEGYARLFSAITDAPTGKVAP
jgi:hypothetical protein